MQEANEKPAAAEIVLPSRFERWHIDRLKPYEKIPRTHSPAQIAKIVASLREFGFTNPILVDSKDGIVAGHGRLEAARQAGLTEVPVVVLDHLTQLQRRAYIIADNRLAEDAGWDQDLLAQEIGSLCEDDFNLGVLGFEPHELEDILASSIDPGLDAEPRIDQAEELQKKWNTATGQMWTLGRHRLLCGDATSTTDLARLMDGKKAECLWTDPPYNVSYIGRAGQGTIRNDSMPDEEFRAFLCTALTNAASCIRPGGAAYVAHADTQGEAFRYAFRTAGFKLSSCLIWKKNSLVLGRADYQFQHEPILYGWRAGHKHFWGGGRDKVTIIEVDRPSRSEFHPTMKPVDLIERTLSNSTRRGQLVLDPFCGSGSTMIACERMGLAGRFMEIEPRFVAVILQRYADATKLEPVLTSSEQPADTPCDAELTDLADEESHADQADVLQPGLGQ